LDRPEDRYYEIERAAGDKKTYPSFKKIASMFEKKYIYRIMGPSVNQSGDPVPRYVIHLRNIQPLALVFAAASGHGKSSAAMMIETATRESNEIMRASVDEVPMNIHSGMLEDELSSKHSLIIKKILDLSESSHDGSHLIGSICKDGLLKELVSLVLHFTRHRRDKHPSTSLGTPKLLLWDGYIPEPFILELMFLLQQRGYIPWNCARDRSLLQIDSISRNIFSPLLGKLVYYSGSDCICYIDRIRLGYGHVELYGWGAYNGKPISDCHLMPFLDDSPLEILDFQRHDRADAAKQVGSDSACLGFTIRLNNLNGDSAANQLEGLKKQGNSYFVNAHLGIVRIDEKELALCINIKNSHFIKARYSASLVFELDTSKENNQLAI
jgi:hypothetical protein